MNLISKLGISLLVAIVAATLTTLMLTGTWFNPQLLIGFFLATAATAILVGAGTPSEESEREAPGSPGTPAGAGDGSSTGDRVEGEVKWFNTAKGFGFIKQDGGDEVFVHFRSIRGTGRRGLRDGQRVTFVVADSDKGPQAEDVEALG